MLIGSVLTRVSFEPGFGPSSTQRQASCTVCPPVTVATAWKENEEPPLVKIFFFHCVAPIPRM